jgi:hypothetical protein
LLKRRKRRDQPMTTCQPDDFAGGCADAALPGSILCACHLRGFALATLDRHHWPRLRMPGGGSVAGDDAWRPWLREATGEDLIEVLRMLGELPAERKSAWRPTG